MAKGSCVCGDWTYKYEGDAAAVAVCHCVPCRKTAGSNGSVNSLIPNAQYSQISGTDKLFTRKGDSGKDVTYHQCSNCSTIMWVDCEALPGLKIVKTGTIDDMDVLKNAVPTLEMYCKDRPDSFKDLSGVERKDAA
ncbi:hypothetical protein Q7P37_011484 [Cladosporium fusiforme]